LLTYGVFHFIHLLYCEINLLMTFGTVSYLTIRYITHTHTHIHSIQKKNLMHKNIAYITYQ
jgi:hypothetical protein